MSKKSYIFTRANSSKRGYNLYICVHRLIRNEPKFVGHAHVNTASYFGDKATANQIIADNDNMKMRDSYNLVTEINLYEV